MGAGRRPAVAATGRTARHWREPRQVVLAWLLARSPRMLPIPGSGSPEHVAENVAAAGLELRPDEVTAITTNA